MSVENRWVHHRLEQWGQWARDIGHLGYPTRSVHEKVNEGGIMAGSPRPPISMPEDIAITDHAIAKLGVIDKSVVHAYYLHWEPQEVIWRRCAGVRNAEAFRKILSRARFRIRVYVEVFDGTFKSHYTV